MEFSEIYNMVLRMEHAKAPQMPNIVEGILSSSRESYKSREANSNKNRWL